MAARRLARARGRSEAVRGALGSAARAGWPAPGPAPDAKLRVRVSVEGAGGRGDGVARIRGIPQEVALGRKDSLPKPCVAKLDNIHLIPTRSLGGVLAVLGASRHVSVKRALGHALFWPELQGL